MDTKLKLTSCTKKWNGEHFIKIILQESVPFRKLGHINLILLFTVVIGYAETA